MTKTEGTTNKVQCLIKPASNIPSTSEIITNTKWEFMIVCIMCSSANEWDKFWCYRQHVLTPNSSNAVTTDAVGRVHS